MKGRPTRIFTSAEIARMQLAVDAGVPMKILARRFGVSLNCIRPLLKLRKPAAAKYGKQIKTPHRPCNGPRAFVINPEKADHANE